MKMFKKSLIAASVAVAATAAYAGTITEDKTNVLALEGAVAAGSVEIGSDIPVTLTTGAEYIVNDVIEFTISGAPIKKVAAGGDPTLSGGGTNFIDLNEETGVVRFRVQGSNLSTGSYTLNNLAVDTSELSDDDTITVSARAVSSNSLIGAYDPSSAKTVATASQQFSVKFDNAFDQVIDVNNSRELFAGSGTDSADDEAESDYDRIDLTITDDVDGKELGAFAFTPSRVVHTITGEDFGYAFAFDADEDGELSSDELCDTSGTATMVAAVGGTGSFSCSIDGNTLTIVQSGSIGTSDNVLLNFNAPGEDSGFTMEEQSFTASVAVSNGTGSSALTSNAAGSVAAGSWTLNGASVYVPYMPYADGVSQIIYVSNKGTQAGNIEVSAFDDAGNEYGPYDLGTAAGKEVTKITGALEDALAADNFDSGKLAFTVTVTAPDNMIEVYTGYNAGNDRGLVINSSNK